MAGSGKTKRPEKDSVGTCGRCGFLNRIGAHCLSRASRHPLVCCRCGEPLPPSVLREETGDPVNPLREWVGREVEVVAQGVRYEGVLVEVGEASVFLKGTLRFLEVEMRTISRIGLKGAPEPSARHRGAQIDPSFYAADGAEADDGDSGDPGGDS